MTDLTKPRLPRGLADRGPSDLAATERLLGTGERVPTVIWNGYGEWVASLYAGKQNERLFT